MNFNDVAIVSVKGSDYRIHFLCMAKKDDAINIIKNSICIQLSKLFFFRISLNMSSFNSHVLIIISSFLFLILFSFYLFLYFSF